MRAHPARFCRGLHGPGGLMFAACFLFTITSLHEAAAQVYKWTDDSGRVHFTDDESSIPARRRGSAGEVKLPSRSPSTVRKESGGPSAYMAMESPGESVKTAPLKPRGFGFAVEALINGRVRADLLIDTGSSFTIISPEIAGKLGHTDLARLPKQKVSTAGGAVWIYKIKLGSVSVGGAVARNVEAAISPDLPSGADGLLGMSYLSGFTYQVDGPNGVITLSE